jgi:hypothetical protein
MPTHAYTLSEFELGDTEHADDLLLPRAGVAFSKKRLSRVKRFRAAARYLIQTREMPNG